MSKYDEALEFLREKKFPCPRRSTHLRSAPTGQLTEAESMFTMMKMEGCCPDVITYTTMIHAFNAVENWEKASAIFLEMEMNDYSLAEFMRDIPFNDATFFEMVSACSMLQDWRTTMYLIKMMEPSFPVISVGLLNQLLHFIGKSGKIETMMKLFYKIVATGTEINFSTYSILLKNLLAAGNWRKILREVCSSGHMHLPYVCWRKYAGTLCGDAKSFAHYPLYIPRAAMRDFAQFISCLDITSKAGVEQDF
ncbi:hypothetical protein ACSBR1_020631 [Camellia fascicularis]